MKRISIPLLILLSLVTLCYGDTSLLNMQWDFVSWNPLLHERLPKLIVLLCTGASLATAGMVMQSIFQNPLASPSVLGINCGASFAVTLVFILSLHNSYPYSIPLAAFVGSMATLFIVYATASAKGRGQMAPLILTGIAVSTLLLACTSALTYAFRDHWQLMQTLTEWEAGSTADRNWRHVHMQAPLALIGLLGCYRYREEINILALGDEQAINLGVNVKQARWHLFLCVSLLTAGATAAVGNIAFFGLVLPHLLRKFFGPDHRTLIGQCIIIGSASLIGLDLILHTLKLQIFSIGNVSSVLGGAFFLILLLNPFREGKYAYC
ncbi:MAG: iron ABC transporter permease [Waddliaceae bacterium]